MSSKILQPPLKSTEKLWNINFFLLWQGQLVSALGDTFYSIALGFWILAVTGSTALMGTLMATSSLPRIIISPFAGVVVDRTDRKWMMVSTDLIRGILTVFIGIAALVGFIEIWMVFAVAIMLGISAAFFGPAVGSAMPDIVPKSKIIQANSAMSVISGAGVLGNSAGGFLFQLLGAPVMFLSNGLSYLFSALTEVFIGIPNTDRKEYNNTRFFVDMKEGFTFLWNFRRLRHLFFIGSALNFFATISIMLILPFFERTEGLGPGRYGITMAFFTGGACLGYLLTSFVNVKPSRRFSVFKLCGTSSALSFVAFPIYIHLPTMVSLIFVAGFTNAILNAFSMATIQLTVPQHMRGKVFSLLGTLSGGLTPIAMALGGVLAEFIPIRMLISSSFGIVLLLWLPLFLSSSFKEFINFDPEKSTPGEVMAAS